MSLFLEYQCPRKSVVMPPKNMHEALTRDMASSDWLKLAALYACVCFARRVYLKINLSGVRPQSNRSTVLSNSLLLHSIADRDVWVMDLQTILYARAFYHRWKALGTRLAVKQDIFHTPLKSVRDNFCKHVQTAVKQLHSQRDVHYHKTRWQGIRNS